MGGMEENRSLLHLPIHRSVMEPSVPPLSSCEPLQYVPAWESSTRSACPEADAGTQTRTHLPASLPRGLHVQAHWLPCSMH